MREQIIMELESLDRVDSTWRIARRLNVETKVVRRELKRMERDGIVDRAPYSTANNTIWRLLPPNDELSRAGLPASA